MSATSNVLWAGLGVAAGYVLTLYVEQLEQDDEPSVDGEGPNLRVVDDDDESSDGEQWMN